MKQLKFVVVSTMAFVVCFNALHGTRWDLIHSEADVICTLHASCEMY